MWAVLQDEGAELAEWGRFAKAESRRREGELHLRNEEEKGALFNFISAVSFRADSSLAAVLLAFVCCRWFWAPSSNGKHYRYAIVR